MLVSPTDLDGNSGSPPAGSVSWGLCFLTCKMQEAVPVITWGLPRLPGSSVLMAPVGSDIPVVTPRLILEGQFYVVQQFSEVFAMRQVLR